MVVVADATPTVVSDPEEGEGIENEELERKREEEEADQQAAVPAAEAAPTAKVAPVAEVQRSDEEAVTADEGLPLTFRHPSGANNYTVTFKTKPLGMDFNANVNPVKISKAFCTAKSLGVQEGSELISIAGVDVGDMDFRNILELLKTKVEPLQPDGLVIDFRDPSGQRKTVVFPTQPLGMDFEHNKMPIRVKPVVPGSAHSLGVLSNSEILSIAGSEVEQMEYDKVLEILRAKTGMLPLKE